MKKIIMTFIPIIFVLIWGCSSNSSGNNPTNPFGGGTTGGGNTGGGNNGGGNGNVTFTVSVIQNQQQNYFQFIPNTGITLDMATVSCAALNVNNQQVQGDGKTVFSNANPLWIGPINVNLQAGQQWTFTLSGKIGSSTGQAYNSTVNYTVTTGGNGGGNVTIQVQGQADGQGNYVISINPNVAISLASVTASNPAQNYNQTININTQFQAGTFQPCLQFQANQIQAGMQFTFKFVGTTTNGNQNFNVTTNYTIP